jgi:hypothetical protein
VKDRRWAGNVEQVREGKNLYGVIWGNLEVSKYYVENLGVDGRIVLKYM